MKYKLNLQRFAEEVPGAAAPEPATAETAPAAESGAEEVVVNAGDTLGGEQVVTPQVAAAMNRQMEKHPELRKVYGQSLKQSRNQPAQAAPASVQSAQKTPEQEWEEAKKGKFAEFYGRDVKSAVDDRFKNQSDANARLNRLEPMLKVLMDRAGVKSEDELVNQVMDDDSLYEEEANQRGMTIPAVKKVLKLEQQLKEAQAREQASVQEQQIREHYGKLVQQAEEFKQSFPGFDLNEALHNDPTFLRLTSPEVGLSVKDAYFAIHHDELAPQMMAYGMERARQQMGQTIQAQRKRPAEGAMKPQGKQAADFNLDIKQLKPRERKQIYDLIHRNKLTIP